MIEIILSIILMPFALLAAAFTIAFGWAAIDMRLKKRKTRRNSH